MDSGAKMIAPQFPIFNLEIMKIATETCRKDKI